MRFKSFYLKESTIPTYSNKDFWAWISPNDEFIQVPKLSHISYIEKKYPNLNDIDKVFEQAFKDGWVRVIYERNGYSSELSLNGKNKKRLKKVAKLFFNLVKYGDNTIYIDWGDGYKKFSTRDKSDKFELMNFMESIETQDYVVVYAGRFQPFHKNHYQAYLHLIDKFGKNNVYIGTSDKVEKPNSPFNFEEKKKIITTMFDVPEDKVVMTSMPYRPKEILKNFPDNTVYIAAVGEKNSDRLGGKYFKQFEDNINMSGYLDNGYVYILPENTEIYKGQKITGTLIRNLLKNEEDKAMIFKDLYQKVDEEIFSIMLNNILDNLD